MSGCVEWGIGGRAWEGRRIGMRCWFWKVSSVVWRLFVEGRGKGKNKGEKYSRGKESLVVNYQMGRVEFHVRHHALSISAHMSNVKQSIRTEKHNKLSTKKNLTASARSTLPFPGLHTQPTEPAVS